MRTKAERKTTVKSAVRKRRQPHGGALNAGGTPGNKGGTGRPPSEFKAEMALLADRGAQAAVAGGVLDDPSHPHWMAAWRFVTDRAYGRAAQSVDVTSGGEPVEPQVIVIGGKEFWF